MLAIATLGELPGWRRHLIGSAVRKDQTSSQRRRYAGSPVGAMSFPRSASITREHSRIEVLQARRFARAYAACRSMRCLALRNGPSGASDGANRAKPIAGTPR